jgi:hypothetical protein
MNNTIKTLPTGDFEVVYAEDNTTVDANVYYVYPTKPSEDTDEKSYNNPFSQH